ncbi:hypothetical protein CL657_02600 [bacterium]|nr:hypothetical protein [bacterium]|tara:strand:- start:299 stop:1153 length:855 start_codon:yes stop_codon:yes gene_type:complete
MVVADLYRQMVVLLRSVFTDNVEFEVECLLKHYFKINSAGFTEHLRMKISYNQYQSCLELAKRRMAHEPLDYILGNSEFMGRLYDVGSGVLIPRSETELLVQEAQCVIPQFFSSAFMGIEFGFGSGIISIELALTFSDSSWLSFDISDEPVKVATKNAQRYDITSIDWKHMDFFESKSLWQDSDQLLFLVANPPYIPTKDLKLLHKSVKNHEPLIALDGGESGLVMYQNMFSLCQDNEFLICLECGINQSESIINFASEFGFRCLNKVFDYQQIPRVLTFTNQI